jgi:hypothetical protein
VVFPIALPPEIRRVPSAMLIWLLLRKALFPVSTRTPAPLLVIPALLRMSDSMVSVPAVLF